MKKSHRSVHEHIIAMGVAIVLVAAISLGINQSWLLSADILQKDIVVAAGDISYIAEGSMLHIQSEKTFTDPQSMTFMVVYNPENVKINAENIKTTFDYTSSSGKDGLLHVTLFIDGEVANAEQLVIIPFEWNAEEVTISDATMTFADGTIDGLAIKKQ